MACVFHSPPQNRTKLDLVEHQVLHRNADHNHGDQAGKDRRDFQLILVLVDEPADAATFTVFKFPFCALRGIVYDTVRQELSAAMEELNTIYGDENVVEMKTPSNP